jgi:hypothetical protein
MINVKYFRFTTKEVQLQNHKDINMPNIECKIYAKRKRKHLEEPQGNGAEIRIVL